MGFEFEREFSNVEITYNGPGLALFVTVNVLGLAQTPEPQKQAPLENQCGMGLEFQIWPNYKLHLLSLVKVQFSSLSFLLSLI